MKLPSLAHDGRLLPRSEESSTYNAIQYGTGVLHKMTRTLVARSSSTCEPGNNSPVCQKPTDSTNTQTLPIVLGAVIPICCAIAVFIYLHRRNKKKQALEDLNDPHKSLDFGVGLNNGPPGGRKKGRFGGRKGEPPEMIITELGPDPMRPGKKRGGLSMDILDSPYLLPAGLQDSNGSLHSMSRAMHDQHDPYRPVTMMRDSSETSRSPRPFNENGSMYSTNTFQTGNEKSTLLSNAQIPSTSFPSRGDSYSQADSKSEDFSTRELHSSARGAPGSRKASLSSSAPGLSNISESGSFQHNSRKDSLPPLPPPPEAESFEQHVPPPRTTSISINRPPRKSSVSHSNGIIINRTSDASFYGDDAEPPPPPPKMMEPEDWSHGPLSEEPAVMLAGRFSIDTPNPSQQFPVENNRLSVMPAGNRLSVMGVRPLPPEDPADNPEQRANRIRSFYKEYFDDSRPNPQNGFYEDWDPAYLETAIYDPETGEYIYPNAYPAAPFAQPVGRRAMTPPPGGLGRPPPMDHARHYSTMSGGRAPFGGRPGPRQPPKKKLPPPKPLMSLPTPHMLKSDEALYAAADLAPPTSFREIQNGRRPDSPMGIQRPYSPQVKAFSPLVPAFDELTVMPSPHHLRKSGTFSALDFAPPRFRGAEGRDSDAGSIRSARSGISQMQLNAVREGAYRVSRIPKEFVTSREDLTNQLRPKMNLISPA